MIPRFNDGDFYFLTVSPSSGSTIITLSDFAPNYDFSTQKPLLNQKKGNQVFLATNSTDGSWNALCEKVTLEPGVEYEISFTMPLTKDGSRMFCPGRDHMSVGFRYAASGDRPAELQDFLFFPPTFEGASTGERHMRFSVPSKLENLCLAFTFASYSPVVASGSIKIQDVSLKKIPSSNYVFKKNETIAVKDKKNVKAMLLILEINQGGETGVDSLIVHTPSNGPSD